jgi:virulence factor
MATTAATDSSSAGTTPGSTISVAFIGAGSLSTTFHYPSVRDMPGVRMAAVCDLIPEKAEKNAATFGIPGVYTDYREMLDKETIDALYIVMPPQDSFELLFDCLNRGLNTFSEKPPTVTTFQAKTLAAIAEENGCITQIGFQRKHIPLVKKLHDMVTARGPMDQFFSEFVKPTPQGKTYYNGRVDVLTCDAIHMVDTAVWMGGGTVPQVASSVRQSFTDQNVKYNALMTFDSGTSGFFSANWNSGRRHLAIAMHGQNCCALIDPEDQGVYYDPEHPQGITVTAAEAAGSQAPHRTLGFYDEGLEFIEAVRAADPAMTQSSFQQSVVTMETVDRILNA